MKVVFVVGVTASGKSELAMNLAQTFGGAIVNCDSIQLYQGLEIGSAAPSAQEKMRVPHFLYQFVRPPNEITAGEYSRLFFECLAEIEKKFPIVFVVGGTGFYFQAIEKGMYPIGAADPALKQQVLDELKDPVRAAELYKEFEERDPVAAKRIFPNDHYRLGRAIEMMRAQGKTPTQAQQEFEEQQKPFPYPLVKVGIRLSKEELMPRVKARTEKMLAAGLVAETQKVLDQGFGHWAPLSSVGYYETKAYLEGKLEKDKLPEEIAAATMRLAKKQRTWFQRDEQIEWVSLGKENSAHDIIRKFIS